MKALILCLGVVCLCFLPAIPAGSQVVEWTARTDGPAHYTDNALAVALDEDGYVYVTGTFVSPGMGPDFGTARYAPDGSQLWLATYNGPVDYIDVGFDVAVDDNGNAYVTGHSDGQFGPYMDCYSDYATIKYNATGVQQWVARYNGSSNDMDVPCGLVLDSRGKITVSGYSCESNGVLYTTVQYDNSGTQRWVAHYGGPGGYHHATALALDQAGNILVTGESQYPGASCDFATVKYNTNGDLLWVSRWDGPALGDDQGEAICVDAFENVIVSGYSENDPSASHSEDFLTVKYDAQGVEMWSARYDGPAGMNDRVTAVASDSRGNIYVTGYSYSGDLNCDFATIKYAPEGQQLWVARYDQPWHYLDRPCAVAADSSGNVYVTGTASDSTSWQSGREYVTLKYDSSGAVVWIMTHQEASGGHSEASDMVLDRYDDVYVTGSSAAGQNPEDYLTLKYRQSVLPQVSLTPASLPVQIPAGGGAFDFSAELGNPAQAPAYVDAWIMQRTPAGVWQGPLLGPISLSLPGNSTITRNRTQNVPGTAAPGVYTYCGYLGQYPGAKWDSSCFEYTKLETGAAASTGGWACTGEAFPGEPENSGFCPDNAPGATASSGLPRFRISPNPFNPQTTLQYDLPAAGQVRLVIFNAAGKQVAVLAEGWQAEGSHEAVFDGSALPSGIYLYRLEALGQVSAGKMVLVK